MWNNPRFKAEDVVGGRIRQRQEAESRRRIISQLSFAPVKIDRATADSTGRAGLEPSDFETRARRNDSLKPELVSAIRPPGREFSPTCSNPRKKVPDVTTTALPKTDIPISVSTPVTASSHPCRFSRQWPA